MADDKIAEALLAGLISEKGATIAEMLEGLGMALAGEGLRSPVGEKLDEMVDATHSVGAALDRVADGLQAIAEAVKGTS